MMEKPVVVNLELERGLSNEEIDMFLEQRAAYKKLSMQNEIDAIDDMLNYHGITVVEKDGGITEWRQDVFESQDN